MLAGSERTTETCPPSRWGAQGRAQCKEAGGVLSVRCARWKRKGRRLSLARHPFHSQQRARQATDRRSARQPHPPPCTIAGGSHAGATYAGRCGLPARPHGQATALLAQSVRADRRAKVPSEAQIAAQ